MYRRKRSAQISKPFKALNQAVRHWILLAIRRGEACACPNCAPVATAAALDLNT